MDKQAFERALRQASAAAKTLSTRRVAFVEAAEGFEKALAAWEQKAEALQDAVIRWDPLKEEADGLLPFQEAAERALRKVQKAADTLEKRRAEFDAAQDKALAALASAEAVYRAEAVPA